MSDGVWVVMFGEDSEGGWVVGVTATAVAGMALANERAGRPLEWQHLPTNCLDEGTTASWIARRGGCDWADVSRYPVSG